MKNFGLLTVLASGILTATAGPLKPTTVSDNAKWIAHLDVEKLLTTELGGQIGRQVIDKRLAKPTRDLDQWGIDFDWREIRSLTAYGTDFKKSAAGHGVLIIESSFDFAEAIEVVNDRLLAAGAADKPIEKVQTAPFAIYSAKGNAFGASFGKDTFLVAKSREDLESARAVLDGKSKSTATSKRLPKANEESFLFATVVEGFQSTVPLPPEASALKSAQSGHLTAAEKSDKVFVCLSLITRDVESATKIQQVLQGLLALAALNQESNAELAKLAQGAKVSGTEKEVAVSIEVPSQTILAKVKTKHKAPKN